jgi:flagellar motor protein MotB
MIARQTALEQVRRLRFLPHYPDAEEAQEILVDMLETAPSVGAARVFVTRWLQDEIQAPMPAQIYHYFHPVKNTATTSAPLPSSKNCPHCNGTGWQIIERADKTTAAKACRCREVTLAAASEE